MPNTPLQAHGRWERRISMRYGVAERCGSSRVREENRRLPQTLDFLDRVGRWPFFLQRRPFRRDDDEVFLANIIGTGTHHNEEDAAEDDGSQYLNDTGDGDDNQTEQTTVQDDSAEVYTIRAYIYKHTH